MLLKYLPVLITGASFFIAIGLHYFYKKSYFLPSFIAATATAVLSFFCFSLLPESGLENKLNPSSIPWNVIGFGFGSGFILALLVGYLMKYAPNLFGK